MVPRDRALNLKRLLPLLSGAVLALSCVVPAFAQDRAGAFDFYVLSLSWSPAYCEADDNPDPAQCNLDLPGFTVHGLWPQYERGWPEYCQSAQPYRLPRSTVAQMSDLMPSGGFAQYQWQKHGLCTGLRPEAYAALLRSATEKVVIPDALKAPRSDVTISPSAIEDAFVAANPGLQTRGMAVTCRRDGQVEVRICLTKTLQFRRCAEVDADSCRRREIVLPAVN